jgi:hypothetical protein
MNTFLVLALVCAYLFVAAVTCYFLNSTHKPKLWKLRMNPVDTIEPGSIVCVDIGGGMTDEEGNTREYRVVEFEGRTAFAIDMEDEHRQSMINAAWSFQWPIMLLGAVIGGVHHMLQHSPAAKVQRARRIRVASTSESSKELVK